MTRWKKASGVIVPLLGLLLLAAPSPITAVEKTITLKGRVDASGLKVSGGKFKVRALKPQDRSVELGKTDTDGTGRFRLTMDDEDFGLYGVVLQATSTKDPALVLEAAVLRHREAKKSIPITAATTVEAAILHWKVRRHGKDFHRSRPFFLYEWLQPLLETKVRKDLKRAQVALVKWAHGAAASGSPTSAAILRASVGDTRQLDKRLTDLKVPSKAVEQVRQMMRTDAEVAYLLMMPYMLEL
ncbi:MAG: hypothetical protein RX318_00005 [bacterium]|nr:hypothetical protein [bacterium]